MMFHGVEKYKKWKKKEHKNDYEWTRVSVITTLQTQSFVIKVL